MRPSISLLASLGLVGACSFTLLTLTGCNCNGDGDGDDGAEPTSESTESTGDSTTEDTSDDSTFSDTGEEESESETSDPEPDVPTGMCSDGESEPGDACFAGPQDVFVGVGVASLALGDLDGAGALDLVVGTEEDARIYYGGDTLTAGPTLDTGGAAVLGVATGQFGGDNQTDIALALPDADEVRIFIRQGNGFQPGPVLDTCMGPRALAAGAFIGAGDDELAVVCELDGTVDIYEGTTLDESIPIGLAPVHIAAADLVGGDQLDLAIVDVGADLVAVLPGGNGGFGEAQTYGVGAAPRFVAPGDVDGDGNEDLAIANQGSDDISLLLGTGQGFPEEDILLSGVSPFSVAIGDFDGDDNLDVASADRADDTISVFLSQGNGAFWPTTALAAGQAPTVTVAADFNQDGVSDLAIGRVTAGGGGLTVVMSDI